MVLSDGVDMESCHLPQAQQQSCKQKVLWRNAGLCDLPPWARIQCTEFSWSSPPHTALPQSSASPYPSLRPHTVEKTHPVHLTLKPQQIHIHERRHRHTCISSLTDECSSHFLQLSEEQVHGVLSVSGYFSLDVFQQEGLNLQSSLELILMFLDLKSSSFFPR